jgi:predicted HTH transcriptional regulator
MSPIKIEELVSRKFVRSEQILKILKENKGLAYTSQELAGILEVSASTITRGLVYLIAQKKVKKEYAKGTTAKIPYYHFNQEVV